MKVKDLFSSMKLQDVKEQMVFAYRIKMCNPTIKTAISHFAKEKALDAVSIAVDYPNGEGYITISSIDLVESFGMGEIEALLYMDAILKANKAEDKSELSLLLGRLSEGKHVSAAPISEKMMNDIRNRNPKVWQEYLRICDEEREKYGLIESETDALIEEEL